MVLKVPATLFNVGDPFMADGGVEALLLLLFLCCMILGEVTGDRIFCSGVIVLPIGTFDVVITLKQFKMILGFYTEVEGLILLSGFTVPPVLEPPPPYMSIPNFFNT